MELVVKELFCFGGVGLTLDDCICLMFGYNFFWMTVYDVCSVALSFG